MSKHIVTRESLIKMLNNPDPKKVEKVIGRALLAIFQNQTDGEKNSNTTVVDNGIGFTGADGYSGCITAKYYIKHGRLMQWQKDRWLKPNTKGIPRIAKYWSQLDTVAKMKQKPLNQLGERNGYTKK